MYRGKYLEPMLATLSAVATALGAQIRFVLGPIPYTMQNLGFVLAGLLLSTRWAALSQLIYIAMIGLGIPAAAGFRGGVHVLIGYTAGYIWSFPLAAALTSTLSRRYLRMRSISLDQVRRIDIAILALIALIAAIPMYLTGFVIFYLYASLPTYRSLYIWSETVVRQLLHLDLRNPLLTLFISSVLIFIPQDVAMDHVLAILIARMVYRVLRSKGMV